MTATPTQAFAPLDAAKVERTRPGAYDYRRFLADRRALEICPGEITPPPIAPREDGDVTITSVGRFDYRDGVHVRAVTHG